MATGLSVVAARLSVVMTRLSAVDARVLPWLAHYLRRGGQRLVWPARRWRRQAARTAGALAGRVDRGADRIVARVERWLRERGAGVIPAALPARLSGWDERYATRGFLSRWRARPAAGVATALVVALCALAVALSRMPIAPPGGGLSVTNAAPQVPVLDLPRTIGPAPGADIARYIAARERILAQLAATRPGALDTAVVDFSRYLTPAEVAPLLAGLTLDEVIYRVPGATAARTAFTARVPNAGPALLAAFGRTAAREAAVAKAFTILGHDIVGHDAEETLFRHDYASLAQAARIQARSLRASCGCVFAVVVTAATQALEHLGFQVGVRLVDPGPPGVPFADVVVSALLPGQDLATGDLS